MRGKKREKARQKFVLVIKRNIKLNNMNINLDNVLDAAVRASKVAGGIILTSLRERHQAHVARRRGGASDDALGLEEKSSPADLVTKYDKQCEEVILQLLTSQFPKFDIVSEEMHSERVLTDRPTWIIDPIDGTTSFVHGLFDCCVSIGMTYQKEPLVGVVFVPALNELFTAIKGRGAFLNGQPISVSGCTDIRKSLVCTHIPYNRHVSAIQAVLDVNKELAVQYQVHGIRSYGSCAMDMCSVACGRLDLYFEVGVQLWDMAAATVIVREAGGIVTNVDELNSSIGIPQTTKIGGLESKVDVTLDQRCTANSFLTSRGMATGASRELVEVAVTLSNKYKLREFVLFPSKL